jgi:hypothetical protein
MYAELVNPNAYVGIVTLVSGEGLLLGGTRCHISSPFASNKDAWLWTQVVKDTNLGRAGRESDNIIRDVRGVYAKESNIIKEAA